MSLGMARGALTGQGHSHFGLGRLALATLPMTQIAALSAAPDFGEPIVYASQRVITLAMADQFHRKPEGTAGRNFRQNREYFSQGTDFFELTQADEIRRVALARPDGSTPAKIILLTESGYLMLARCFQGKRAWEVQRMLVDSYFRAKAPAVAQPEAPAPVAAEIDALRRQLADLGGQVAAMRDELAESQRRRPATGETRRLHLACVRVRFGGLCPCCLARLLFAYGTGEPVGVRVSHWFGPHRNKPAETWPVCARCIQGLRDPDFRQTAHWRFGDYQAKLSLFVAVEKPDLYQRP